MTSDRVFRGSTPDEGGGSAPSARTGAPPSRREFLAFSGRATAGGWLALHLPALATLASCAREDALNGEPLDLLSEAEGRTLDAVVARLIPSVDGIGAREAGAVHFIDRALGDFFAPQAAFFRGQLAPMVDAGFEEWPEGRQIGELTAIEDTPFFGLLFTLTVFGTFSDPRHGGGRNDAIQRIYGIELRPGWDPPFGHYDAEVTQ